MGVLHRLATPSHGTRWHALDEEGGAGAAARYSAHQTPFLKRCDEVGGASCVRGDMLPVTLSSDKTG
jgi:hypothetical protein